MFQLQATPCVCVGGCLCMCVCLCAHIYGFLCALLSQPVCLCLHYRPRLSGSAVGPALLQAFPMLALVVENDENNGYLILQEAPDPLNPLNPLIPQEAPGCLSWHFPWCE